MQAASNKLVSVADSIAKWNNRKREMMERIKPNYYDRFTCIADKCTFTCCQEWKIAVDNETNRKWKKEISAAGSEGAAEKSQCLYNQKRTEAE